MHTKLRKIYLLTLLVMASGLIGAQEAPHTISVKDIKSGQLVGWLQFPLGAYLTIEGTRQANPSKSQDFLISVDTVNKTKLKEPVVLEVVGVTQETEIGNGTRLVLRGYEWGGMEGFPIDPETPLKDQVLVQSREVGFYVRFRVSKVLSPAQVKKE